MKKYLLSILFLLTAFFTFSQNKNTEQLPTFSNCENLNDAVLADCFYTQIQNFVFNNFKISENLKQNNYTGNVIVLFEVDTTGNFKVQYVDAIYPELIQESKRVFSTLPKIKPATFNGKSIYSKYTINIAIPLENVVQNRIVADEKIKLQPDFKKNRDKELKEFKNIIYKKFENPQYTSQLNIPFSHNNYNRFDGALNQIGSNNHTASKPYTYAEVAKYYDLKEENNWQPDFVALEKLDLSKVKLMWVNYPHMPTGANGNLETFTKLIAFGKKHQILIVNDNPYSFILSENQMSIFQVDGAKEIALELNSLSKTFNMAGWRVGMILGNKTLIDTVLKVKSNIDSGMFYGIQKGAITALKLGKDWFETQNKIYDKRRNLVFKLAAKLNCTYDENSVGLFVWAKLPANLNTAETFVDELLHKKNIFVTPGTIFGSNGEGFARFSLCIKEEKIIEAINRI